LRAGAESEAHIPAWNALPELEIKAVGTSRQRLPALCQLCHRPD
jgi:hypothetical protein